MPKLDTTPKELRPYLFHGLDLEPRDDGRAHGDCPFCSKPKFSVALGEEAGPWRCWVCGEGTDKGGGNVYTFLRLLWDRSDKETTDYRELQEDRRLLYPETLMAWGVCRSFLTGDWLVPGFGADGKLNQLYKYVYSSDGSGKRRLLPTPTLHHQLHGVNLYDGSKPEVYVCEGPWDAMALWEALRSAKPSDDGSLTLTASEPASLYARVNVLAVPGCQVFAEPWCSLLAGKRVTLLYDSDHPKNGAAPAGYSGMRHAANVLSKSGDGLPESVHYLCWGPDGWDRGLPSGFDVRDGLTAGGDTGEARIACLGGLLAKVQPIPADWVPGRRTAQRGSVALDTAFCNSWRTLTAAWKRSGLRWIDGLDYALSVMLATVASTRAQGSQLWVQIISPPSTGKSVLCEAVSTNKKYTYPKSTLRGFHSGSDDGSGENHSPLAHMLDKTLVVKDGDSLLQAPNIQQILSEARDIYDRVSRSSYRNRQSKDWEGVNLTIVLCGTNSLRQLDHSELGERFLKAEIMSGIDDDLEDEILWRVANRAARQIKLESNGQPETQDDPDMVRAKQLTGGYVDWLRVNARDLLAAVDMDDDAKRFCTHLGKFVSFFRARPSKVQDVEHGREMAARLTEQFIRLASCLAIVLNERAVGTEALARTRRVALDTAKGHSMTMARHLYATGEAGMTHPDLALLTNWTEDRERTMLRFLRAIGVVESYKPEAMQNVRSAPVRWRLTRRLTRLWKIVVEQQ